MEQITISQVKELFPRAYADLLSGFWVDDNDTPLASEAQWSALPDTFHAREDGKLVWQSPWDVQVWCSPTWGVLEDVTSAG